MDYWKSNDPDGRIIRGLYVPFLIEDVLVKYPKLRIYIMHAGEVYHENALRLMAYYPQLYCDLGYLLWVTPLPSPIVLFCSPGMASIKSGKPPETLMVSFKGIITFYQGIDGGFFFRTEL